MQIPRRKLIHTTCLIAATGLLVNLADPAHAQPRCNTKGDPRSTAYQFRQAMDRCEGIRGSRPISAVGMRLASYTIGQPHSQSRQGQGEVIAFQVPAAGSGSDVPRVTVQARGGDYQMTPMRLGSPLHGWRPFEWGVGLLRREGISTNSLRATALLSQPGGEDQWLPVKFSPAGVYNLVISSNGAIPVANVRILAPDNRVVWECSGPTRLEKELQCRWDGRTDPAGRYRLLARSAEGGASLLNVSLRHDPGWLTR